MAIILLRLFLLAGIAFFFVAAWLFYADPQTQYRQRRHGFLLPRPSAQAYRSLFRFIVVFLLTATAGAFFLTVAVEAVFFPSGGAYSRLFLFLPGFLASYLLGNFVWSAIRLLPIARPTTPFAIILVLVLTGYIFSALYIYVAGAAAVLRLADPRGNPSSATQAMTLVILVVQSVVFLACVHAFSAAIVAVSRRSERRAMVAAAAILAFLAACVFWCYEERQSSDVIVPT